MHNLSQSTCINILSIQVIQRNLTMLHILLLSPIYCIIFLNISSIYIKNYLKTPEQLQPYSLPWQEPTYQSAGLHLPWDWLALTPSTKGQHKLWDTPNPTAICVRHWPNLTAVCMTCGNFRPCTKTPGPSSAHLWASTSPRTWLHTLVSRHQPWDLLEPDSTDQ